MYKKNWKRHSSVYWIPIICCYWHTLKSVGTYARMKITKSLDCTREIKRQSRLFRSFHFFFVRFALHSWFDARRCIYCELTVSGLRFDTLHKCKPNYYLSIDKHNNKRNTILIKTKNWFLLVYVCQNGFLFHLKYNKFILYGKIQFELKMLLFSLSLTSKKK